MIAIKIKFTIFVFLASIDEEIHDTYSSILGRRRARRYNR
jgi:hypothetical protein